MVTMRNSATSPQHRAQLHVAEARNTHTPLKGGGVGMLRSRHRNIATSTRLRGSEGAEAATRESRPSSLAVVSSALPQHDARDGRRVAASRA